MQEQSRFYLFVAAVFCGIIAVCLSIAVTVQNQNASNFSKLYDLTKCDVRTVITIEKPFLQNISNTVVTRQCYYYKHLPNELIIGDAQMVDPALIASVVISWFISIGLVLYLKYY
jgi:hypothetical protein